MLFNRINKNIKHNKEKISFFFFFSFKIISILLALFFVYFSEYRIYNANIKPVIEYTNFITVPNKKFITIVSDNEANEGIFIPNWKTNPDIIIHSKKHENKKNVKHCELENDTKCFIKVRVASLKGKFWQHFLVKGILPDTPDDMLINESLANRLKLGVGDKAWVSRALDFKEKRITGIIKNSYGFPEYTPHEHHQFFCYFDMPLENGTFYSFSDNKDNACFNVSEYLQNANRKIHIVSFIFFMVLFVSNVIALFCIQKVTTFRQYCNRLLLLGIKRRYIRRKQIMFYMIFMLASMLFSCGLNLHFFIVNAFSAIFAVMINLFLKRYKKYAHS